jgi:hypothetical protein
LCIFFFIFFEVAYTYFEVVGGEIAPLTVKLFMCPLFSERVTSTVLWVGCTLSVNWLVVATRAWVGRGIPPWSYSMGGVDLLGHTPWWGKTPWYFSVGGGFRHGPSPWGGQTSLVILHGWGRPHWSYSVGGADPLVILRGWGRPHWSYSIGGADLVGHTPWVGQTSLVILQGCSGACALSLDFSQQVLCEKV